MPIIICLIYLIFIKMFMYATKPTQPIHLMVFIILYSYLHTKMLNLNNKNFFLHTSQALIFTFFFVLYVTLLYLFAEFILFLFIIQ